jgi:hypothetical protein
VIGDTCQTACLVPPYQRDLDAFALPDAVVALQHSTASMTAGEVGKYLRFARRAIITGTSISGPITAANAATLSQEIDGIRSFQAQLFELRVEVLAVDAEQSGSFCLIPCCTFQRPRDHASLKSGHGLLEGHIHKLRWIGLAAGTGFAEQWQVLGNYQGSSRKHHGAFDEVPQLTNVARVVVGHQCSYSFITEPRGRVGFRSLRDTQKVFGEGGDVTTPVTERRHFNFHHVEAIK